MEAYICDYERYKTDGEFVGAWFELPVNEEEVQEQLQARSLVVMDVNVPVPFQGSLSTVEELNELARKVACVFEKVSPRDLLTVLVCFGTVDELYEHLEQLQVYEAPTMEALAHQLVEEGKLFCDTPKALRSALNYSVIGMDLLNQGYVQGEDAIYKVR